MADPASIAGILGAVVGLGKTVYQIVHFISDVRDAPEEIKSVLLELKSLRIALQMLEDEYRKKEHVDTALSRSIFPRRR